MDPTGPALIFGGLVFLARGVVGQLIPLKPRRWPTLEPRRYDRVQPRWCYWLGLALIVVGILW